MPMKISLALGPNRPLSPETAWGCLSTNLALPGFGSLVAGRASGYAQAALAVSGLLLTLVFGVRFILWYFANWSRLQDAQTDPILAFVETLLAVRWSLLGMGLFGFGWLWALVTSLDIVRAAKNSAPANVPPKLSANGWQR
jgi:hypothetical protein